MVKQSIILHQTNILHGLFLFLYMIYFKRCNTMICVFIKAWRRGTWWLRADVWASQGAQVSAAAHPLTRGSLLPQLPTCSKAAMHPVRNTSSKFYYVETPPKTKLGRVWFVAKLLHWRKAWTVKSHGAFCRGMRQFLGYQIAVINTRCEGRHWTMCSCSLETCVSFAIDF